MMIKILSYFLVMVYVSSVYGMDHVEKVESDKNRSSGKIDNQGSSKNDFSQPKSEVLLPGWVMYQGYHVPPEVRDTAYLYHHLGIAEKVGYACDEQSFLPALLEREKYSFWPDYWVALIKCYEKNEGHPWYSLGQ